MLDLVEMASDGLLAHDARRVNALDARLTAFHGSLDCSGGTVGDHKSMTWAAI